MAENPHSLLIGARGWIHPQWKDSFYPDDLPVDWQLGFYANEFSMVVITQNEWTFIQSEPEVLDDIEASFRFLCEISLVDMSLEAIKLQWPLYQQIIERLGKQCAGIIFRLPVDILPDNETWQWCVQQMPDKLPCYVDFETWPADANWQIWKSQSSLYVVGREDSVQVNRLVSPVVRVGSECTDLKQLRMLIEQVCLCAAKESTLPVLIMEGQPPDVEMLRNAHIITELL
ncbi:MAG: hypothetical protein OQK73_02805 [Gammaproteobacteria bacterium]|nr:hypothetical protein [Gammaproteobacteria bacterium]